MLHNSTWLCGSSGVARLSWLPGLSEVITRLCAKHAVVGKSRGMPQSVSREGVKIKLRFLCAGGFTCSVQSTLRNAKHEPPRGSEGMPPRKFLKNVCSEIESGAS